MSTRAVALLVGMVLFMLVAPLVTLPVGAGLNAWTTNGPARRAGRAVVADPAGPAIPYAGTDAGVFKSVDGATTWSAASSGLTDSSVRALAIDPVTPTTLYAGTDAGVFKSTNGAGAWSP